MSQKTESVFSYGMWIWSFILLPFSLLSTTAAFYWPSLEYPFQFDDIANITKKFDIRIFEFKRLFKLRWMGEWLSMLNYQMGRFDPFYFRLTNLVVHLATGLILFYLIYRICSRLKKSSFLESNALLVSFITSGLFLLHPVQTQGVSYIIQARLEGLATLFILLTLLCFVLCAQAKTLFGRISLGVLLAGISFLSFGTKEIIIITPFLSIIIDWFFISNQTWKSFKTRLWMHGLIAIIIFGCFAYYETIKWYTRILGLQMTTGNNRGNILTTAANDIITPLKFLISEFKVILHYMLMYIWPFNISVEYDWKLSTGFFAPDSFFPFLALAAIGWWCIKNLIKKENGPVTFGLIWFFIAVAPRSSIVPSPELLCDYKAYPASVGLLFILAMGITYIINFMASGFKSKSLTSIHNKIVIGLIVATCALYVYGVATIISNVTYNLKTFASILLLLPAAVAWMLYYAIQHKGTLILYTQRNKALFSLVFFIPFGYTMYNRNLVWESCESFWEDITIKAPLKARAHNNYGVALSEAGKYDTAIEQYKTAIRQDSDYCDPWSNLAVAYSFKNEVDKAIAALKNAIRIFPHYPEAYNNLGSFLLQKKDYDSAEHSFQLALKLRPHYGKAFLNLGRLYLEKGENEKSWEHFVKATEGDLDNWAGFAALGEVATKLGKYKEAIAAFTNSISLLKQGEDINPKILFALANSYYMEKQYDKSLPLYNQLVKINPQHNAYAFNLAETYFATENYEQALKHFNLAKDVEKALPQSHFRIVTCLQKLDRHSEAQRYLDVLTNAEAPDWFLDKAKQEMAIYKEQVKRA